jgi:hypothetical protein
MRFEVDVDVYDPQEEHFLSAVQGICIRPNSAGRKNCMNGGTLKCRLYVDETSHWRVMRTFVFTKTMVQQMAEGRLCPRLVIDTLRVK